MKKRIKMKIKRRAGYKKYENFFIYLSSLLVVENINDIINHRDQSSVIQIVYQVHPAGLRIKIYEDRNIINNLKKEVHVYTMELKDHKDEISYIITKQGKLFHNHIKDILENNFYPVKVIVYDIMGYNKPNFCTTDIL